MPFITNDFLLHSEPARRLYHEHAAKQPVIDYHCHLSPYDIAVDRRFENLFELWLEGDHYKWRAMRTAGVPERYCTGDATPHEKYLAWAETVPKCLRNPLYHWTHLELRRYFGITDLLGPSTAETIWSQVNERLRSEPLTASRILESHNVRVVCTTDDPADDLRHHAAIRPRGGTKVLPTFRPDASLRVDEPDAFVPWVQRLSATADVDIASFGQLLDALERRHAAFHEAGGRLSDHGLPYCYGSPCTRAEAERIFGRAMDGIAASPQEHDGFSSFLMLFFGHLDAGRGWTKQLHLGARRNVSSRMVQQLGRDTGFDSMGDWPQVERLGAYLDRLEQERALPRTIVYNSNPADNDVMATMIGNFQDGSIPGRIQFGSAWWFLDQKHGIESQLDALSNAGLLSQFVGMVTDSRSFMSFPRHEYFRRVLCNVLGAELETGELPADTALVGGMVEDICYRNAERYLGVTT